MLGNNQNLLLKTGITYKKLSSLLNLEGLVWFNTEAL